MNPTTFAVQRHPCSARTYKSLFNKNQITMHTASRANTLTPDFVHLFCFVEIIAQF